MRRFRPILFSVLLASSMAPIAAGCGKKGPPLAPFRPLPAAIADLAATRRADTVDIQFTVPTANADGTTPADLAHVDVYALTGKAEGPLGRPLMLREIEQLATRIARLDVQPPPLADADADAAVEVPVEPATPADTRPAQGATVRVEEVLTDAIRSAVFEHPDADKAARLRAAVDDVAEDDAPVATTEGSGRILLWPQPVNEIARQYIAIPYSTRERAGVPTAPLAVPLVPAPPAPPAPAVTHDATTFHLSWTTPPGVQLPVQPVVTMESYKEAVAASQVDARLPARPLVTYGTPHGYRVYQLPGPDAPASQATGPLNPVLLGVPAFSDARMEFGVPRCYAVRTVEQRGPIAIESPLSPSTCVTATDAYPPPAPTGLVAVGSEGGVALLWEPVTASDLAGYLVLRGVEGAAALEPITAEPVVETTYRDTTAQAGVMYIYAVVAVDRTTPANASPESNRVREAAR